MSQNATSATLARSDDGEDLRRASEANMKRLRAKHKIFIAEYLACGLNGTEAAKRAGYNPANARFYASRLLSKANIRAELAQCARSVLEGKGMRFRGPENSSLESAPENREKTAL